MSLLWHWKYWRKSLYYWHWMPIQNCSRSYMDSKYHIINIHSGVVIKSGPRLVVYKMIKKYNHSHLYKDWCTFSTTVMSYHSRLVDHSSHFCLTLLWVKSKKAAGRLGEINIYKIIGSHYTHIIFAFYHNHKKSWDMSDFIFFSSTCFCFAAVLAKVETLFCIDFFYNKK